MPTVVYAFHHMHSIRDPSHHVKQCIVHETFHIHIQLHPTKNTVYVIANSYHGHHVISAVIVRMELKQEIEILLH